MIAGVGYIDVACRVEGGLFRSGDWCFRRPAAIARESCSSDNRGDAAGSELLDGNRVDQKIALCEAASVLDCQSGASAYELRSGERDCFSVDDRGVTNYRGRKHDDRLGSKVPAANGDLRPATTGNAVRRDACDLRLAESDVSRTQIAVRDHKLSVVCR